MSQLSLEEKVDLLLKYHRRERMWGWLKLVFWIVLFVVFVVLPLLWLRNFVLDVMESEDFAKLKGAVEEVQEQGDRFGDFLDRFTGSKGE